MGSTVIYRDTDTYEDGSRYEMVVAEILKSNDYPEGIRYRFQYMTKDGQTILRFDNFPDHPGVDRHHYHTSDGVYDDIEYTGPKDHIQTFYERMDTLRSGDQP